MEWGQEEKKKMPQNEEGSRTKWICVQVPQSRLTQERERERETHTEKHQTNQYKEYKELKVRMHENA